MGGDVAIASHISNEIKILMKPFFSFALTFLAIQTTAQNSSYGKEIDSLWNQTYQRHNLIRKTERIGELKLIYSFYKNTKKIRSITVFHVPVEPGVFIYFYKDDSIIMISPVG